MGKKNQFRKEIQKMNLEQSELDEHQHVLTEFYKTICMDVLKEHAEFCGNPRMEYKGKELSSVGIPLGSLGTLDMGPRVAKMTWGKVSQVVWFHQLNGNELERETLKNIILDTTRAALFTLIIARQYTQELDFMETAIGLSESVVKAQTIESRVIILENFFTALESSVGTLKHDSITGLETLINGCIKTQFNPNEVISNLFMQLAWIEHGKGKEYYLGFLREMTEENKN